MKESHHRYLILTTLFPLGPLWLIGFFFIYAGGMHYWIEAHKGDDFAIAVLELVCILPIAAVLSIVLLSLIFFKIKRIYLPNFHNFIVVIPLIGILVYVIINAVYFVEYQHHLDVPGTAPSWKVGIGFTVANSLFSTIVEPFRRIYEAPPAFYDGSDKFDAIREAAGHVLIPLIATTLFGVVVSLLVKFIELNSRRSV